ncbi:MAG: hypothetical protein H7Z75_02275, partial [Ferruginibacter sp.]|nr:hypothetical protein [Cytophagales bacterium]
MADKIKVTFQTIDVITDGEPIGKGELYWNFLVDNHVVDTRSAVNPTKVSDGATINLTKAYTVTKEAGQILTIAGSVGEKDNLDKDDFDRFSEEYNSHTNWGFGTHK